MKRIVSLLFAAVLFGCDMRQARAQTTSPQLNSGISQFETWLGQQQAHAGIGYKVKGDKAKYAVTWWDLVQVGQSGLNIAQPTKAHDYIDIGPANAVANQRGPRWGAALPIHFGNLWNDIRLPASVATHINATALPPFIVSYILLYPEHASLSKLRPWSDDGMVAFSYGFGGS